jgi:iron complex outermembrane receptor protein
MIKKTAVVLFLIMGLNWILGGGKVLAEGEGLLFYDWDEEIVTASQESEPLLESPVVVSVVTKEMIEKMGAKNLKDVLVTIPGFSFVQDQNEVNVAFRGIYGSSQQKFLILRDGHRLNCRSYSEANPDYSITLAGVKRIEIIRGPGSSLYGDVALTAVVNIITENGIDVDGTEISFGAGNYGQVKMDMVYGTSSDENKDLFIFTSFYRADGQKISRKATDDFSDIPVAGNVIVDKFGDRPSYDVGVKYRVDEWAFAASRRYCAYTSPRSCGGVTGEIYDYEKVRKFTGLGPGLSNEFTHSEWTYSPQVNGVPFRFKFYYDDFYSPINLLIDADTNTHGFLYWRDYNIGLQGQATVPYSLDGKWGKGTFLTGIQTEFMEVYDSDFWVGSGSDYSLLLPGGERILKTGKEMTYSAYGQVKHRLEDDFIFNMGLRYDYKDRRKSGDSEDSLSPRASVIYLLNKELDFKLSYTKSFVDAPYWYRYNSLPSYMGAESLKPEIMNSYQFSVRINKPEKLINRLSFFYNNLSDLVYRDVSVDPDVYCNAGKVELEGMEYELEFKDEVYSLRMNYTFQYLLEAKGYGSKDDMIKNIPQHMGNIIVDFAPLYRENENFWTNLTFRYIGEQESFIGNESTGVYERYDPDYKVDDVLLVNLGFTLKNIAAKDVDLGLHIYNLTDREYYQGGA